MSPPPSPLSQPTRRSEAVENLLLGASQLLCGTAVTALVCYHDDSSSNMLTTLVLAPCAGLLTIASIAAMPNLGMLLPVAILCNYWMKTAATE
jgi:hypothetical protein